MIKPGTLDLWGDCCHLHHCTIWLIFSHQPAMDTIETKYSFVFFPGSHFFFFLLSLWADVLYEAWGLLWRFYDCCISGTSFGPYDSRVSLMLASSRCFLIGTCMGGSPSSSLPVPCDAKFPRSVPPLHSPPNMISSKCFTTSEVSKKKNVVCFHLPSTKKSQKGAKQRCRTSLYFFQKSFLCDPNSWTFGDRRNWCKIRYDICVFDAVWYVTVW